MINISIIALAAILLAGHLYCEKRGNRIGLFLTKIVLSFMFILAVLVQPHPISRYYHFLLGGFILCLGGDVFLALPQKKMFLFGLISFLFGHAFFVFAFFYVAKTSQWTWVGSLVAIIISGSVYFWLKPHLKSMKTPVLIYIIVITIMLCGAWSVIGDSNLTKQGRIMVFAGAFSFYLSDLFVARDRFLKKEFLNRLIGLPMYYAGQFLLAFSVGLLRQS